MLPISAIQRMGETVDAGWRSPVADAVGAVWGLPPGTARWLRSSSTHVFVVGTPDAGSTSYLRFAPESSAAGRKLAAAAELMCTWAVRGIRVVEPIPSIAGLAAESVETLLGTMTGMLVPAADGIELSVERLTVSRAAEWGAALGAVHRDGAAGAAAAASPENADPPAVGGGDPEYARAAAAIAAALGRLDPGIHSRGICHGDFELDNLRFGIAGPICFDVDEAHTGWLAGDIASAVRDLTGATPGSEPSAVLLEAFLRGYRTQHPLSPEEEHSIPLHSAAASIRLVAEIAEALGAGADGDGPESPDSLPGLRATLREHLDWHRRRVMEWPRHPG